MKLQLSEIRALITALGYQPQDGEKNIFWKSYALHGGYIIKVNFDTQKIEYGSEIQLGDLTTSNFENSENFVVLECINRLLEKGYAPKSISLEHKWPMGRKEKGKLDILVLDQCDKAYLMIECKTWGVEFDKEKKKMLRDGGQLFSYYVQNKATQYLCLYASQLANSKIEYVNDIVKVDELWRELDDQKDIFLHWNKSFKDNGVFEGWVAAYDVEIKAITRGQLKELTTEDSSRIFNQFAEILRHNVVSDKPNAFNKILNLFICKIIDEDKNDDEEVAFQWLENDTSETLQTRLNDLYKDGMHQFLGIEVTDYSDEQLENKLLNVDDPEVKKQIQNMFLHLRLQKNPEFAFKEVYNEDSFADNAIVIKEVVELLQPYQFRYGHKQQFLGDFFELLLNTSIKQEAGQFFTPVPIAKFIVSSLPIKEFIGRRLAEKSSEILPYAIDYAAGSGHFLTEWMDELQSIIDAYDTTGLRPSAKKQFEKWKGGDYNWAGDYVYGIEADYRLVKTAKVSSFLNGDGEAKIIRANGLDKFDESRDYVGILKEVSRDNPMDNGKFDILIANPPYAVSAFKNTVQRGEESFELFNRLTDTSSEIECLFIERAKQLLREGGWAGIILPSSILSNSGIYTAARDIILKYFKIKAIVELGSNTFMATGTNTVILFLERRSNTDHKKIESAINSFFERPKDATVLGIENAFNKFIQSTYEGLTIDDYISMVAKKPNENVQRSEIFAEYKSWFCELTEVKQLKDRKVFKEKPTNEQQRELDELFYRKIFEIEKDKLLCYILTCSQQVTIIKVGEKQDEKNFLGYEFSNRRGSEGIKMYRDAEGSLITKLYNEYGILTPHEANYYIYHSFCAGFKNIDNDLLQNISNIFMTGLFDFGKVTFDKSMSTGKREFILDSKYPQVKLQKLITTPIQRGKSANYGISNIQIIKSGQARGYFDFDFSQKYYVGEGFESDERNLQKEDVLINSSGVGTAGRVTLFELDGDFVVDSHISIVRLDNGKILPQYALYALAGIGFKNIESLATGQSGQIELTTETIGNIRIPLPPLEVQKNIINELQVYEKHREDLINKISLLNSEKTSLVSDVISAIKLTAPLHKFCFFNPQRSELTIDSTALVSFVEMASVSEEGCIIRMEDKPLFALLKGGYTYFSENDIIIAKITPCMENGKCALASGLTNGIGMGSTEFHVIRVNSVDLIPKFAFLVLNREEVRQQAKARMTGKSGHRRVPIEFYEDYPFPIVPMDEQRRIVERVEELEREIDEIKTSMIDVETTRANILNKYMV